jgi:hypothetical protein
MFGTQRGQPGRQACDLYGKDGRVTYVIQQILGLPGAAF